VTDETIQAIRDAAKGRARADAQRRKATDELRELVARAKGEGEPIARIAREARLSRQGVYELLDRRAS
jgi:hypothetical protein